MGSKNICLLGGTGFVGRHLASELARRGYRTRVLTRRRERHRELLVIPTLDLIETDVHQPERLAGALSGCDSVVNLIGILNERGREGGDFASTHAELPKKVAEACRANGITRLLHMSALNASSEAPSQYLQTKARGEAAAHEAGGDELQVTSFRPSVIFGFDDSFFNRFAALLRLTPFVFPLACPQARFAPVYIEDVVQAFADSLQDKATWGARYDLCGPHRYTLKELVEYTAQVARLKRTVIGLNDRLSKLQARVLDYLPEPPFSIDNYLSMQVDCVSDNNGFGALGIEPTSVEAILPRYIGQLHRNARYQHFRGSAGRG